MAGGADFQIVVSDTGARFPDRVEMRFFRVG